MLDRKVGKVLRVQPGGRPGRTTSAAESLDVSGSSDSGTDGYFPETAGSVMKQRPPVISD